jgi:hypothetical protein
MQIATGFTGYDIVLHALQLLEKKLKDQGCNGIDTGGCKNTFGRIVSAGININSKDQGIGQQ